MICYAIVHRPSGQFMPQLKGKGYSHWNPSNLGIESHISPRKLTGCIRLFETERKAIAAITAWYSFPNSYNGYNFNSFHNFNSFEGEQYDLQIEPDKRKKEDLEIVKINLKVKFPNKPFWENLK